MLNLANINNLSNYIYVRETIYEYGDTYVEQQLTTSSNIQDVYITPPGGTLGYYRVMYGGDFTNYYDLYSKVDNGSVLLCGNPVTYDPVNQRPYPNIGGDTVTLLRKGTNHPAYGSIGFQFRSYTPITGIGGTITGATVYSVADSNIASSIDACVPTPTNIEQSAYRVVEMKTSNFI